MDRQDLINAINGCGFPTMQFADQMVKEKVAIYTGNQHNWEWAWDRAGLEKKSDAWLLEMYQRLKAMQRESP